jgi:CheY-like chemotaxis protein
MNDRKLSILIVDDDRDLRGVYAYNFQQAGFEVFEGNDGLEGLNLAKEHKPDAIFTGIMMPNMDGFEFLKVLKSNMETSHIPVLISSHLGKEEDHKKAMQMGAAQFLVKGMVTPVETVGLVKEMLLKKTYEVVISSDGGDAAGLITDFNLTPPVRLVLTGDGENGLEFKAKLLK